MVVIVVRILRYNKTHRIIRYKAVVFWNSPNRVLPMLIVITLLIFTTVAAERLCYDLQGKYAPDKRPCNKDGHSICCGESVLCLSNHACLYTYGNVLSRGVNPSFHLRVLDQWDKD